MPTEKCKETPVYRYTWPGRNEAYACLKHGGQIRGVAEAMGMYLQLISLTEEEAAKVTCSQDVTVKHG